MARGVSGLRRGVALSGVGSPLTTGSSRTSHGATPATYADDERFGATETCNRSYIKTGETAETPEPKWYGGGPGGAIVSQGLLLRPPGREHAATGC